MNRTTIKKIAWRSCLGLLVALMLIQLVPYGRSHANPPVGQEPAWSSPATRQLAVRACYDCHSNETKWLWYSHVAPASWLVQHDVDEGRKALNFSEWNKPQHEADEAAEVLREGEMPLWFYVVLHGEAQLTSDEKNTLAAELNRIGGGHHGAAGHGKPDESEKSHD